MPEMGVIRQTSGQFGCDVGGLESFDVRARRIHRQRNIPLLHYLS
jgi:hypothetical protein